MGESFEEHHSTQIKPFGKESLSISAKWEIRPVGWSKRPLVLKNSNILKPRAVRSKGSDQKPSAPNRGTVPWTPSGMSPSTSSSIGPETGGLRSYRTWWKAKTAVALTGKNWECNRSLLLFPLTGKLKMGDALKESERDYSLEEKLEGERMFLDFCVFVWWCELSELFFSLLSGDTS